MTTGQWAPVLRHLTGAAKAAEQLSRHVPDGDERRVVQRVLADVQRVEHHIHELAAHSLIPAR